MRRSLFKTVVMFMLLTTLLLLGTIGYCYSMYVQGVQREVRSNAQDALQDASAYLRTQLDALRENAGFIADQTELHQFGAEGPPVRLTLQHYVRALLTSFANFQAPVVNAYFYTYDGSALAGQPGDPLAFTPEVMMLCRRIADDYRLRTSFREHRITDPYAYDGRPAYFALLTPIYSPVYAPRDTDYMGCLVTLCHVDWLWHAWPSTAGYELLVTRGDSVFYSTDPRFDAAWRGDAALATLPMDGGTAYRVLPGALADEGFVVRLAYRHDAFSAENRQVRTVIIIIGIGTLLTHMALMLLLYRAIISPIRSLARQTDSIHDDLSRLALSAGDPVELSMLAGSINNMLARICQLNDEMLDIQLQYLRTRVLFLQCQINPHFLYNNLECVRGMATAGDAQLVRDMVSCIAGMYRYSSKADHIVTVEEELNNIGQYERILQMRYGSRYALDVQATPEALGRPMLRMTLQPLVENAIQHGFEAANRNHGRIAIRADAQGECLRVTVCDDGQGMAAADLAKYNAGSALIDADGAERHIGIANVYSRIRLVFGPQSSMQFAANAQGGLCITVRLYKK